MRQINTTLAPAPGVLYLDTLYYFGRDTCTVTASNDNGLSRSSRTSADAQYGATPVILLDEIFTKIRFRINVIVEGRIDMHQKSFRSVARSASAC